MPDFEKASRLKLRFKTHKGLATVEDIWVFPLRGKSPTTLNTIAKALKQEILTCGEEDYVDKTGGVSEELQLSFDIAVYIIDVRLKEIADLGAVIKKAERNAGIKSIIADKKHNNMLAMSVEDLEALLVDED